MRLPDFVPRDACRVVIFFSAADGLGKSAADPDSARIVFIETAAQIQSQLWFVYALLRCWPARAYSCCAAG
jgi:hypothetical protein